MKIALGIIIAVLVMLLAGLGWYAFTLMQENEAYLATINTMNMTASQEPVCTSLDASGIAIAMTSSSDEGEKIYCVSQEDLSIAFTTEQMTMEESVELLTVLETSVEDVQECMTAEKFINESAANISVCDDISEVKQWPDVIPYDAQWGGCEFVINKAQQAFSYCAQAHAGSVITCTQDGCEEGNTMTEHETATAPIEEKMIVENEMIDPVAALMPIPEEEINEPVEEELEPPLL